MKKILFLTNFKSSNIRPKLSNFTLPSYYAAVSLGYEFHMNAPCESNEIDKSVYDVHFHKIPIYRKPLSIEVWKSYKVLNGLLKQNKFDVIHCNTPIGGVLGRICGKKAKVPRIIYTAHGFHFYKGASLINRTLFKWAEMWLARYTDVIITINREDYKAAQKFKLRKNGKVYYVPGVGVDTSLIKDTKPKREELVNEIGAENDSVLLISIGELNKNKNNEVIIKALGKLKNPKIHYILCGVGDKKDELHALSKEFGLEENIHFLGYRTDIAELLKSCDIFVMPSYREGLSRSLMEAMSAGLSCVVSEIRGNIDLIEEDKGGYLCKPDDVNGFAESINNIIKDEDLRKRMVRFNIEKVKMFDIENIKKKMQRIYSSIIKE